MTATGWNQKTIERFNAQNGRDMQPWGDNLLLMTARGARSGELITTPLVYRREGGRLVVVASKGGAPAHPQWYHNIQLNPVVDVEVAKDDGIERFPAQAKVLPEGPERDRLYDYMTEVWPAFADYQTKTDRTIPIVILEPEK